MVKASGKSGFTLPENEFDLYTPSWFNHFSAWAENKPLPKWLIYALISPLLLLFGGILQASTSLGTIQDFNPIYLVAIVQTIFLDTSRS